MADKTIRQHISEFFMGLDPKIPTKPLQVGYKDLLDALASVDPSTLISRKLFSAYNPEQLVTRKGMGIFDKMKRDEQVKAALRFKKDTILSSGWEVVSPDDEQEDWEVTQFIKDQLNSVVGGWEKSLRKILIAIDYGYSITEKVFKELEEGDWKGKVGLGKLISCKPHFFDFTLDEQGQILSLIQRSVTSIGADASIRDPQFPPGKFVIYTHSEEFENPYGTSDLVAAYRAWWVKDNAYKWFSIYLERFGMPPFLALYNPNAYQGNQIDQLKKLVKNIQNSTFGLVPRYNKEDIELWTQQIGAESKEIFISSLEKFDRDISRALLVPGLLGFTADEATGSLARSGTHFDSFVLVIQHLQSESAGVVNSQLIKPLCDLNYPGLVKYPEFKYLPFKDDNRFKIFELWQALVAGKVVNRIEDDEQHVRRSLGMPDNAEPVLEPLPAEADREAEDKRSKEQAKVQAKQPKPGFGATKPKPVPKAKLSEDMLAFAEENDAEWFEIDGEFVCYERDSELYVSLLEDEA